MLRLIFLLATVSFATATDGHTVFEAGKRVEISVSAKEKAVVQTALGLLQADVRAVFGAELTVGAKRAAIVVGTLGVNAEINRLEKLGALDLSAIRGKWEAFRMQMLDGRLFIVGSDARGTAYGLMELSRMIGVSPWYWWADVKPLALKEFVLPDGYWDVQAPSVRYRGIFINDEDWGLLPWASKTFEPGLPAAGKTKGAIGPKTYSKIFELLLRLRANAIWPAMHECTVPFYLVEGNREVADKYGIVVGTTHCEPLMRNSATEWDLEGKGDYNFLTNSEKVLDYWSARLKMLTASENIFTIGMRGKHDGMMQGVKTLDEHKNALSQIIPAQRELLKQYINPDIEAVPQVFVPYKEVLDVYEGGLKVPEDVTLMWCDDNYGYIRRLSSAEEQRRAGGSGVYYHVSYWGQPHDYLWLATTSPALLRTEMLRAYKHGADRIWILNVGDIKPAEYLTEYFMDLAWSAGRDSACTVSTAWAKREFGAAAASEIAAIMTEYYRLANFRKPEHTGWNRVEQDYKYPDGVTPVLSSSYNPLFNNELNRRIDSYLALEQRVAKIKVQVPTERLSAFFELVEYPVRGASLLNRKWLCAQMANYYADKDLSLAKQHAANSLAAYDEIVKITEEYNSLEDGKWRGVMDFQPRKLPVFKKPDFARLDTMKASKQDDDGQGVETMHEYVIAKNASQADTKPDDEQIIAGLGHSFAAVQMRQGEALSFTFDVPKTGSAIIKIAAIPNHDVDGQGMKIAVAIDGTVIDTADYSVKGRSEAWKQNVLRGQAISVIDHIFAKPGAATITVKALSPYIILDQIALDMSDGARYYEFPVVSAHSPSKKCVK